MSYKTRKLLCAIVLLIGLPAYIALAWWIVNAIGRPSIWVELGVYLGLGVLWALPLRKLFLGIGKPDPEASAPDKTRSQAD